MAKEKSYGDIGYVDEPVSPGELSAPEVTKAEEKKKAEGRAERYATKKAAEDAETKGYEDASERAFKARRAARKKSAGGGKKKKAAPPRADIGQEARLGKLREQVKPSSAPGGRIDMADERKVSLPASKAPSVRGPRKRGVLRRAISAVGRGFHKAGRGAEKAFGGSPKSSGKKETVKA